jgi:predicted PurR-regulated permease PerM
VALVSKPLHRTAEAVQEAGHVALPVVALGVIIAILYFGRVLFITSITAVMIAFILDPLVGLFMRLRLPRSVASFVVCVIALLFLYMIGLAAYSQLAALYDDLPKYGQRIGELRDAVDKKMEGAQQQIYQLLMPERERELEAERARAQQQAAEQSRKRKKGQPPPVIPPPVPGAAPGSAAIPEVRIHEERTPLSDYIYSRLDTFYQILLMASFIPFLVYFMLSWRDHVNRSFLQFFNGESRAVAARSLEGIAGMVRAFVVGNFLLGIFLAVLSSTAFLLLHLPYAVLVGSLSGLLSLMPYIGLPLALVPPLFASLTLAKVSIYVLVAGIVMVLHLIALNVLNPKLVGSRVHLNPLVVTFSLMFWGFLWDAAGLLLAIPMTAAIKAVCDNVKGLRPFGKFLGD